MYQEQLLADGMVPEVVPTFGPSKTSCAWGDAACILPWNVYLFSGDKTILEQQIDSMKAWVDYIRRVDGEHHGWRNSFHYGDWLALDPVREPKKRKCSWCDRRSVYRRCLLCSQWHRLSRKQQKH